jgi:hypothetical protein
VSPPYRKGGLGFWARSAKLLCWRWFSCITLDGRGDGGHTRERQLHYTVQYWIDRPAKTSGGVWSGMIFLVL